MLEVPLDAWYVWIGLAVVSTATLGVVSVLPSAPPPDASGSAHTIDSVAASDHAAMGKHPLSNADAVRVGSDSVSLRGAGGTAHANLGYGPVTPVEAGSRLESVLRGTPPDRVFDTVERFEHETEQARRNDPQWQHTDELVVRRVSWEGVDAVLVG